MKILSYSDPAYASFVKRLNRRAIPDPAVRDLVGEIISEVASKGDAALLAYTKRFDGATLGPKELFVTEEEFAAAAKAAARNGFEGLVLEMRGLTGRKHGGKIDSAMLTPLLDAAEEWLYTDEGERASSDELTTKLAELRSATAPATARYYEAVAADKVAEESALETAAVQAAAERAAAGEDEDHDTRELELRD